ncbi:MAG: GNAT family N-acetyltransferase [Alphaproteobacteria bacterium]|nr:GNAT family N-acetyltransferase [Alphaproteobacteria bacterium]
MPCADFGKKLHDAICDGYDDYVKWLNWPMNPPTPGMVEEDCRKHHADFILRDFIRYLIIDKSTNDVVGRCAFVASQALWKIPQFGIAYFVRRSQRSKGYASEAAHAMTALAFQILKAKKVEIHCDAENIASAKVPQKLGFKLECTQRGGWPRHDGELAELQIYSIFSERDLLDWNETLYLMKSPTNHSRLMQSIENVRKSKAQERDLGSVPKPHITQDHSPSSRGLTTGSITEYMDPVVKPRDDGVILINRQEKDLIDENNQG